MQDRRPEIDYPVRWTYKVIGEEESRVRAAVMEVLASREFELTPSHRSRHGTYVSFSLDVVVEDESVRNGIFVGLGARPEIRYVL
jgi:hypothetical protein